MRVLPFRLLFGFVLLLLIGTLAAVFFSRHEWAWAIGILFLSYDAVLLTAITTLAWRGVVRSEAHRTWHVQPPELAYSYRAGMKKVSSPPASMRSSRN